MSVMGSEPVSRHLFVVYVSVLASAIAAGLSRLGLAFYLAGLGAGVVTVSSLTSWFMGARSVSSILGSVWSDLSPVARRVIVASSLFVVAGLVYLISLSRSVAVIIGLNTAWGFMGGLFWPLVQTVASSLSPRRSGTVMSVYFAIGSLGTLIGQFLYGRLGLGDAAVLRLSALLFIVSGAGFAYVGARAPLERIGVRRRARGLWGFSEVLGAGPMAFWIILAAFAAGYASGILREFLYIYLHSAYGYTKRMISDVLSSAGLLALGVVLAVGPLSDRLGTGRVLVAVLILGVIGHVLLGLGGSPLLVLLGLSAALAAGRASLPLTRNAVALGGGRGVYASLVGLSNMLSSLGQVVGPLVAGWLYSRLGGESLWIIPGRSLPFLVAAAVLLATLGLYPLAVRAQRRWST